MIWGFSSAHFIEKYLECNFRIYGLMESEGGQ